MSAEVLWLLVSVVQLSIITLTVAVSSDYCLAEDTQPYLYFSTKTAYEITQQKYEPEQEVLPRGIQAIPDCTPVGIWMLIRHGTRYPHFDEIKRFRELINIRDQIIANNRERGNGKLCGEDVVALKGWTFNVTEDEADELTWQGEVDLRQIAKRLKGHFRELLDATYTDSRFSIHYTNVDVTKNSAKAFTKELFGRPIEITDNLVDPMLSPQNNCTSWIESFSSDEYEKEETLFRNSNYMRQTIHEVSERLGFKYDLSFDAIYDIYDLCRYEKAWYYKSVSPWCAAFTHFHLKVLEYYEDLSYYYGSGYGKPYTASLGCPLVQDLIYKIDNITKNGTNDVPPITFYFIEELALKAVLTRLGIAKDSTPLKHSNFNPTTSTKRQWRTSIICPFAGNLAVVLYLCQGANYKVMFYLNEQFIDYAGCHVGLCDWSYIMDSFSELVNPSECNLDFCYEPSFTVTSLASLWLLILTTSAVLLTQ